MTDQFIVRYAEKTVEEVARIHKFVSVVSTLGGVLFGEIDPKKSSDEIHRIVFDQNYGFALVAEINNEIVGSIGLVAPEWWYNHDRFFTDRWFFVYPVLHHRGIAAALEAQVRATIPEDVPLLINGKLKRRNKSVGGGVHFQTHRLIAPGSEPSKH